MVLKERKFRIFWKRAHRQFSLLSSTTAAINECEDISDVFTVACRNIRKLPDKAGTISFELDNPAKIYASGLEDIEPWFDEIKQITGLNLHHPALGIW